MDKSIHLNLDPTVNIITPILNGEKYLAACIRNVLNQNYSHVEHIFIDGGSSDKTISILEKYKLEFPGRVTFISGPDGGVGDALNKGLKISRGDIIGWLDADDLYAPDAIIAAVHFFNSNPQAKFLFGGCNIIAESGEIIGEIPIREYNFKKAVRGEHYISLSAAFFRREVVDKAGFFNKIGNNLDFWIRIATHYKMYRTPKILSFWRLDSGSVGFSQKKKNNDTIAIKLKEDYLLCRKYGGNWSFFAPRSQKYFLYVILTRIRLFHFINITMRLKLRKYRPVQWLLRSISA